MESRFNAFTTEILESIRDGFVFLDREMRYAYVNAAAEKLLNKARADLLGRHVWEVFPQPPDSPFRGPVDEAVLTREPTHVEGLNVRRGIWFDCYNYPSEEGLTIIFRDVTPQRRAEAARAESEARFRMMADAAPVLIWRSGLDRGYTFFNQRWLDFTGRTAEQEHGFGWAAGVHPDDQARCRQRYTEAFERREPFVMEFRLRRHDGVYRWMLDHGVPLLDGEGAFTGYIGSCVDLDERRRAEERLAFLAEASEVLFATLDYEATLNQIAHLMVPQIADWVGVEVLREEGTLERVATVHSDPAKLEQAVEMRRRFPPDQEMQRGLWYVIRTGESVLVPHVPDGLLEASTRDPEYRRFLEEIGFTSLMLVPLKGREKVLGAVVLAWSASGNHYDEADLRFAQELARRAGLAIENALLYQQARAAEERLTALNETLESRVEERTQELERSNMDLQHFASVASHDLQEPLRKVRTFLEMLREEVDDPSPEALLYMERMQTATVRMSRLISDLLELSQVATSANQFQPTDLNHVVSEVLSDLEVSVADAGAQVEVDTLCTIDADPVQMRQLFQNLIGNALKFRRKDASAFVRIKNVPVNGAASTPRCRIQVEDNGVGFDERYAERIFQPFRRLHGRSEYAGTGMGLAICRRITERHGGSIEARSEPGAGSTFTIELPLRR